LIKDVRDFEKMGFDYLEWRITEIESLSKEEFKEVKGMVGGLLIKPEVCNYFFPSSIKITGPEADDKKITEYIERALERTASIGTEVVVVGSGGSRNIPDGWNRDTGIEQFCAAMRIIGNEASKYGITAVIEPLNRKESNIVNSVMEGFKLVQYIDHPNVKLLADFYHMRRESEKMDNINKTGIAVRHVHIANSIDRSYPKNKSEDEYEAFFTALKSISYTGRMSVEARAECIGDYAFSLKLLKELSF